MRMNETSLKQIHSTSSLQVGHHQHVHLHVNILGARRTYSRLCPSVQGDLVTVGGAPAIVDHQVVILAGGVGSTLARSS